MCFLISYAGYGCNAPAVSKPATPFKLLAIKTSHNEVLEVMSNSKVECSDRLCLGCTQEVAALILC